MTLDRDTSVSRDWMDVEFLGALFATILLVCEAQLRMSPM